MSRSRGRGLVARRFTDVVDIHDLGDPVDSGISLEVDDERPPLNPTQLKPNPTGQLQQTFLQKGKQPTGKEPHQTFLQQGKKASDQRPTFLGDSSDDSGSEFELSVDDSSSGEMKAASDSDSDSEFELSLDDSSGELAASPGTSDSEFELGPASDSSTENPSLGSDSDQEFELSLDDSNETSRTRPATADSDFEVGAATDSSTENPALEPDSDSEFELGLDSSGSDGLEPSYDSDSDSEFDLTLDDSGTPSSDYEEEAGYADADADRDIFETDFEVPGLDDESGSQDGAYDTDLESSDFDIEDESGSQVVALDDSQDYEEYDDAPKRGKSKRAAGKHKGKGRAASHDDEEFVDDSEIGEDFDDDYDQQGAFDELATEGAPMPAPEPEVIVEERVEYIRPAPWGVMPVVLMVPCLLLMAMIGLMGFEQLQNVDGRKPDGMMTKFVKDTFKNLNITT